MRYQKIWVKGKEKKSSIYGEGKIVKPGGRECEQRYEMLEEVVRKVKPRTVLDIGADKGYFSFRLAEEYDINCQMIERKSDGFFVMEKNENPLVSFTSAKIKGEDIKKLRKFDLVLCFSILHHLSDWERVLEELCKKTKDMIIEIPTLEEANALSPNGQMGEKVKGIQKWISFNNGVKLGEVTATQKGYKRETFWIRNSLVRKVGLLGYYKS